MNKNSHNIVGIIDSNFDLKKTHFNTYSEHFVIRKYDTFLIQKDLSIQKYLFNYSIDCADPLLRCYIDMTVRKIITCSVTRNAFI